VVASGSSGGAEQETLKEPLLSAALWVAAASPGFMKPTATMAAVTRTETKKR
jgi:hypothetical protein